MNGVSNQLMWATK